MILGILGHALRFAVFAYFPDVKWLVIGINVVHGICYAFFFATVYIFVDEYLPKDIRSSAQGLFNLVILGLGQLVANFICPILHDTVFASEGVVDYKSLMLVPCLTAIVAAVALGLLSGRRTARSRRRIAEGEGPANAGRLCRAESLNKEAFSPM